MIRFLKSAGCFYPLQNVPCFLCSVSVTSCLSRDKVPKGMDRTSVREMMSMKENLSVIFLVNLRDRRWV